MKLRRGLVLLCLIMAVVAAGPTARAQSPYAQWANGPPSDPNWFPIGVWLQSSSPSRVAQYQAAGFNIYVGLWQGPTESQLADLKSMNMPAICAQNSVGLNSSNNDVIIAWMQQDEPDNAQWNESTQSYGPPVLPSEIVNRYNSMKANDATRPVFMNLGRGVAWDLWWGRGTRTNHPEDYPQYLEGCDIASFDIYPFAAGTDPRYEPIKDKPWIIPFGVDRLNAWKTGTQTDLVWNFVECTNIGGTGEATPIQVKAEVWMSLVHGSMGILYFVHEFNPFIEAGLLADPVMTAAVTEINNQITSLAPVLNGPTVPGGAAVQSSDPGVPVDIMVKQYGGATYLFAVGMRDGSTTATFQVAGLAGSAQAEVLGESRTISFSGGSFQDSFSPYAVHLYRIVQTNPEIAGWQVVSTHGPAGELATDVADNYIEPRLGGLKTFRAVFNTTIDPATLLPGAVTIVGQASGDVSSLISGMTLDGSATVMTVTLSSPLADADTYTITVTGSLRTTGGLPVGGDVDIVLKTLGGDVDGSGNVTALDMLAIRVAAGQPVVSANSRLDVDTSGVITAADVRSLRQRLGNSLP
ncbi:MAG: hypothetical protein GWP05_03740 [Anaerolineaceae bacterium]|nr:hypothetical protein [Anaerolineaceae bacterium]